MSSLELIDCHVHSLPTYQECNDYASWAGIREPAPIGTLEQLTDSWRGTSISGANIVMLTPSKMYYQQRVDAIPQAALDRSERERAALEQYVQSICRHNDWGGKITGGDKRLTYFCGVDAARVASDRMLASVERWVQEGARGVKVSTANMALSGDDPRLVPLYDYCQSSGLPILAAAGNPRRAADLVWAHLPPFARPLRQFPRLKLIFAHMGYFPHLPDGGVSEMLETMGAYPNVCTDLSLRLDPAPAGETPEDLVALVRKVGVERVLFATNFPFGDVQKTLDAFWKLPLEDPERELIGRKNFERLIG